MKHIRTATTMRTQKLAAIAAALGAITLGLTACGGDSTDGTYYIQDINGTSDLGQLVVEGDTLTHHEYDCDGVYDEPGVTTVGVTNEEDTQDAWTMAGVDSRTERTSTDTLYINVTSIILCDHIN